MDVPSASTIHVLVHSAEDIAVAMTAGQNPLDAALARGAASAKASANLPPTFRQPSATLVFVDTFGRSVFDCVVLYAGLKFGKVGGK